MEREYLVHLDIRQNWELGFTGIFCCWYKHRPTSSGNMIITGQEFKLAKRERAWQFLHRQPYLGSWGWLFLSTTRIKFWQALKTQLLTSLIIPLWSLVCVVSLWCFSKIHCIHRGIEEEPKLFEVHLCNRHSSKWKTLTFWKGRGSPLVRKQTNKKKTQ